MRRTYSIPLAIAGAYLLTLATLHGCAPTSLDQEGLVLSGGAPCVCTDDANECTDDLSGACPDGDEKACHIAVAGRTCGAGQSGSCDALGMCIPCNECSDVGCTQRCVGQPCAENADCANAQCVDGFCCNSDCVGECNACNRVPGTCTNLPAGMKGECGDGMLCGNGNGCKSTTKKPLGELCIMPSDCESGKCVAQICVSPDTQPCVEHLECASRLCDSTTHTCTPCGGSAMCPAGASCVAGQCQAFPGQPALTTAECVPPAEVNDNLTCTLLENATCTNNAECIYHRCVNGKCAKGCMIDAECPSGMTCNANSSCRLPKGSYCVVNDQCQGPSPQMPVGTCDGFPRRCM